MIKLLLHLVIVTVLPQSAAGEPFKLCHFETLHTMGVQSVAAGYGILLRVDQGIVWYVDEDTGTIKTQLNDLCVHQRTDALSQMELAACDGQTDWKLVCPNNCQTLDDQLRHYLASPDGSRIAVWGDHAPGWAGGLKILMEMQRDSRKSILIGRPYSDYKDDFGTKFKKC